MAFQSIADATPASSRPSARPAARTSTPPAASWPARCRTAPSAGWRTRIVSAPAAESDSRANTSMRPASLADSAACRARAGRGLFVDEHHVASRRSGPDAAATAAAHQGGAAAGARQPARGTRRGLLRTRPDGCRAAGTRRGGETRPDQSEDLQRLRPGLRDARAGHRSGAQFPQGARTGAERFRVPPELGLVPVHARRRPGSRFPNSSGGAQPAVQDARDRADQRRALRRLARRKHSRRRRSSSARWPFARTIRKPRCSLAQLSYKEGRLRRSTRADEAGHAADQSAARSARAGRVHRAQAGRPQRGGFVHFAAAQPLSGFRRKPSSSQRGPASDRRRRPAGATMPQPDDARCAAGHAAARGPRGRRTVHRRRRAAVEAGAAPGHGARGERFRRASRAARSSAASCATTRACCASMPTPCWPRCPKRSRRPRTNIRRWRPRRGRWANCPPRRTLARAPRAGPFRWRWSRSSPWPPSTRSRGRRRITPPAPASTSRRRRRSLAPPAAATARLAAPTTALPNPLAAADDKAAASAGQRRGDERGRAGGCRRRRPTSPMRRSSFTFRGTSWVEVRDATGALDPVGHRQRRRHAGGRPARRRSTSSLGNAAAVDVTWLGKSFDTAPFTRQNVAKFTLK